MMQLLAAAACSAGLGHLAAGNQPPPPLNSRF
jgi:hypothetical protein